MALQKQYRFSYYSSNAELMSGETNQPVENKIRQYPALNFTQIIQIAQEDLALIRGGDELGVDTIVIKKYPIYVDV